MKPIAIPILCAMALFVSCARQSSHSPALSFKEPGPITRGLAARFIHPEPCSFLQKLTGSRRLKDLGRDLLLDMGGMSVAINTEYGTLEGMYFDPEIFRQKETAAYKKWRQLLAHPKNVKLSLIYEVSYEGHSLPALFSMPRFIKTLKKTKDQKMGALCIPSAGLDYEFDPQFILTYLLRGMHVLVINYPDIEWKKTCIGAKASVTWLANHLKLPFKDITICGKSFGSGPAVYAAIECPGSHLIIDRGFARLSDTSHTSAFIYNLIEKYYRFPNEDWISQVKGKVLIIEAREDHLWKGHAERLFEALSYDKTKEEKEVLKKNIWITVSGGHYSLYWGDPSPSWYTDDKSQSKLDAFLAR